MQAALQIVRTSDGSHTIFNPVLDVHYHSLHGAVQESTHVFIEAALNEKSKKKSTISVLEMGFGTGLNALLSLQFAAAIDLQIKYTAYETEPIPLSLAMQLNYPDLVNWPPAREAFEQLHATKMDVAMDITPYFQLEKRKESILEATLEKQHFDIIYYDAFAPQAQAPLWEPPLMQKLHDCLLPDGVLTTYCAQGAFKRNLRAAGFQVEALPGPPGKREMTRAWAGSPLSK